MIKSETIGELIFGENNSDEIGELFFSCNITKEKANEVLEKIKNSEIVYVLKCLKEQINREEKNVRYSALETEEFDCFSSNEELFLFSDHSYSSGFIQAFYRLLDRRFPEYKTPNYQPIGEILMTRK